MPGDSGMVMGSPALLATCFHNGFLLGLFFIPEDGSKMLFYKVG
jgi:hypothetical protein